MARMQARKFFLNTATRQFISSPDANVSAAGTAFFREDVEDVELYFVEPAVEGANFRYVDYSSNTVKLAVGLTAPAAFQTSWTALSTTITASITTLTNGGSGASEVQRVSFSGGTPAQGGISLTMPSRAASVSSVSAGLFTAANHGFLDGQQVTLSSFTISGSSFANTAYFVAERTKDTFRIANAVGAPTIEAEVTSGGGTATLAAITTPVVEVVNAENLQQAFVDAGLAVAGAPQIVVSGSYAAGFVITFANTQANINFDALVINSTLAAAPGLTGLLNFDTNEVASLISAGNTSNLRLECEVADGTKRQTYASGAAISSDIIASSSPAPLPTITPATSFNLISPDTSVWNVTIDDDGVLAATKV